MAREREAQCESPGQRGRRFGTSSALAGCGQGLSSITEENDVGYWGLQKLQKGPGRTGEPAPRRRVSHGERTAPAGPRLRSKAACARDMGRIGPVYYCASRAVDEGIKRWASAERGLGASCFWFLGRVSHAPNLTPAKPVASQAASDARAPAQHRSTGSTGATGPPTRSPPR